MASKRIEIDPDHLPGYTEISKITGITSPTHLTNLVFGVCGLKLAAHLASFDVATVHALNQATRD